MIVKCLDQGRQICICARLCNANINGGTFRLFFLSKILFQRKIQDSCCFFILHVVSLERVYIFLWYLVSMGAGGGGGVVACSLFSDCVFVGVSLTV